MNTTDNPRGGWTSASSASYDAACPGRHLAQRGLPEEVNEDAESGTRIHAAVAGADPPGLTGDEREQAERLQFMRDAIVAAWLTGKALESVRGDSENDRLWLEDPETGFRHSGLHDYAVIARSTDRALHGLIVDYKTGRVAVDDPALNMQLRDLAVLLDVQTGSELETVTCQIIQPWVGQYTPVRYTFEDLNRAADELILRIRASNDPKSPRIAGEAQCKYCRAKSRCPEFAAMVEAVLPQPLTVERAQEVVEQADTLLPQIPNEKLAKALNVLGLAEKWIAALRTEARARLKENPGCLPGWKLTPGMTRQAITDVRLVWSRWGSSWPGQAQTFLAAAKLVKADLKDSIRSVSGLKGKALTEALDQLIEGATTDTVTSPRLVREGEEEEA